MLAFSLISLFIGEVTVGRISRVQAVQAGFKLRSDLHYVCSIRETIVGASEDTAKRLTSSNFFVADGNLTRVSKFTFAWALNRDNLPSVDGFPLVAALTQQRSYISADSQPERATLFILANGGLFEHQMIDKAVTSTSYQQVERQGFVPVPNWGGGGSTWMPANWVLGSESVPVQSTTYVPTLVSQPVDSAVPYWPFALPNSIGVGTKVNLSVVNPRPAGATIPCTWTVTRISKEGDIIKVVGDLVSQPNDDVSVSGTLSLRPDWGTVEACQLKYAFTKPLEDMAAGEWVTSLWYERVGGDKYQAFVSKEADARRAYAAAKKLYDAGKFAEAQTQYAAAFAADRNNADYADRVGDALFSQNKYEEAKPFYVKAHALNPYEPYYVSNLGRCYAKMGDISTAATLFEQATAIDPKNAGLEETIAEDLVGDQSWKGKGNWSRGEPYYRKAVELAPDDCILRANLALDLLHVGNNQDATDQAKASLAQLGQNQPENFVTLGEVYLAKAAYGDALPLLLQALRLLPKNVNNLIRLGEAFAKIGNTKFEKDEPTLSDILSALDALIADGTNQTAVSIKDTLAQCKLFLANLSDTSILPIITAPLPTWKDGFLNDEIPYNLKVTASKPYDEKTGGYPVHVSYVWSGQVTGQHEVEADVVLKYDGTNWVVQR